MKQLILASFIFLSVTAYSQSDISEIQAGMISLNKNGMTILGSWAIANIGISGVRYFQTQGETQRFHQMNVFWNFVNLGLAGGGIYQALNPEEIKSNIHLLNESHSTQTIFLVNAALDLGYMAGGLYMIEKAKNVTKNSNLLSGFGKSIILQGAFLLIFDGIMFASHKKFESSKITPLLGYSASNHSTPTLGFSYQF